MKRNRQTAARTCPATRIRACSKNLIYAGATAMLIAALLHLTEWLLRRNGIATRGHFLDELVVAVAVATAFLWRARATTRESVITDRLQSCQDRTSVALSTANIAVWEWDLITGEQNWSPNCHAMLGLAANVTASIETFISIVHPDDRPRVQSELERSIRERRDHHCEFRIVFPDGSVHWQLARARPFYDADGKPVRIIGIAMDISERKRSEEQLRLQAQVLDAVANAVVITDPDAHILWANPAFTRLTGYALDEVRSQNPRFLKSGRHTREFYADMWQTIKAGNVWQGELINRRKDGTLYDEDMTITPVKDDSGIITNFVAIKRDITARKRLEERLRMLANAVENSSNLIAMTGPDLRIVFVNTALLEALQCTEDDLVGQHVSAMLSGDAPPDFLQQIANPDGWRGECHGRRKDGTDLTGLLSINPILSEKGEMLGLIGIAQDVTERKRAERDLIFKNALLQAEAEATLDGILAVDSSNRVILSNRRFAEIWGVPQSLIDAGDDAPLLRRVADQVEDLSGFIQRVEYLYDHPEEKAEDLVRLKDGRVLERYSSPMRDPQGTYLGRIWFLRDISDRIRDAERMKLWSEVLDQSAEGIFVCNAQEQIIIVNPAFERLTGLRSQEVRGKAPMILRSRRHDLLFYSKLRSALFAEGSWHGEIWLPKNGGEPFIAWLSITAVYGHCGAATHFVGIFSDVTAHKQDQERMLRLAHYDALTNLPNRTLLIEHLNQMTSTAERKNTKVAVIFLDLDRFKEVNDSLGHESGDVLLQAVAKRLSSTVRAGQDTVARMGGDEFVVVLSGLESTGDLATVAQKLLSCFLAPINVNGHQLTVTASIGISVYPDDGRGALELIRSADAAMYQAKSAGRNNFKFYTSDLQKRAMDMLSTENALRRAVDQREFFLEYQPQVNIQDGRLVGAEALIRWNRPGEGRVMPGQFIALAEERGLIVPIGAWVIDEVCRQVAAWRTSGALSIPIALNVSAVQFRQRDFVDYLAEAVGKFGIAPAQLEIELTEGAVIRDPDATAARLQELHQLGFRLAIDDFGTGYSSLAYLRRFPFHKIKIDRSFVVDTGAANIVTAVITLARSLNLKVIAEGVETTEQLSWLRGQNCDEAQGYLLGPAVSAASFETSIAEWQRSRDPNDPFQRPLTGQKTAAFA